MKISDLKEVKTSLGQSAIRDNFRPVAIFSPPKNHSKVLGYLTCERIPLEEAARQKDPAVYKEVEESLKNFIPKLAKAFGVDP